jgi:ligand-binding sensor domain-containing protein
MKRKLLFICIALFLFSCEKDGLTFKESAPINFDVSERILEGEKIECVDFDSDGNAWIGAGSSLLFYDGNRTKNYEVDSEIRDLSVGLNGKVWIATKDRGLALFSDGKFTYYTMQNSGLPRDYIIAVEAAPDGSVWFSSSAHMLGGLMHFDGKKFELFTPENSDINQNLIIDLKVDKNGDVFFSTEGTVTETKVFMIDKRKNIIPLGGDASFYWISALDVNSKSEAVIANDHSLSSCMGCYTNDVIIFRNGKWNKITTEFEMDFFNRMFVDKRDFIWVQGSIKGDYQSYFVYDGRKWHRSKKDQLPDAFIYSVKVDPHNSIWFCTSDGIYILNQS